MRVNLVGADALIGTLKRKAMIAPRVAKVIKSNGGKMQEKAKRYAPVDTGKLKNSITLQTSATKAEVSSTAPYAIYQEFGTRYQPGTPHIKPAYRDTVNPFLEDMRKVIRY